MKYKMFATDLDGTLLNGKGVLSEKNEEAIRHARSLGVKTLISSGRAPQSLKHFEEKLGNTAPGCYGIGFNGSVVYEADSHRVLQAVKLDMPTARFILDNVEGFSADVLMYMGDTLYMRELNENTKKYVEMSKISYRLVSHFDELEEEPYKVFLRGTLSQLTPIYEHMKDKVKGRCNIFFTSHNLLEFTHLDGTKGNGLQFLAGYLGIDPGEVIAVGDNFNDISMIKAAGLGVAVANAEPEVLAAADVVTEADNSHDAIAEIIEKYILEEFAF